MPRPPARAASKKRAPTVTRAFLFSDLRGYTDFVEAHGDAAAAKLLREYRTLVRREVARHDGAEVKTEGDSFYVVFESPSTALDCAVSILRRASAREQLRIGMGLHAGETITYDDQFVGSAVNIAARLASKAGAGELLASDTVRGLVRTASAHEMDERGLLELKGVREPVRVWSVRWEMEAKPRAEVALPPTITQVPAPRPGQVVCPVVIGRGVEVERLAEALDAAGKGTGQALLLTGEAGVGKTAFVREAQRLAAERGFRFLYGTTLESDSGLPYGPFVAAVRSGFRGLERDQLARVLTRAAPDLAQLFPELGRPVRGDGTPDVERNRLAVAFQHLFTTFAREGPVVIVLEDLHWADEASLELLHYLAREMRDARAMLLATYRSDELHRRHPLVRVLANLQRDRLAQEIALRRLTRDEVGELIQRTFGLSTAVSAEFRDVIYGRSEGNPFFTEELLKSLVETGDIYKTEEGWDRKPIAELRIPSSLRDAVRLRVERVSESARAALASASAIGQRFPFDLLRVVRGVDESSLESSLRELIEQQLFVEIGGDEDVYGFRHALTREVIYEDLLVRERKRLHRGVAAALVTSGGEPSIVARHLIAAGDGHGAVPHLLDAAERAARADAPREAAAHFERAIEIGVPEEALARTLEHLAETYHYFDFQKSLRAAEEAAGLYREGADRRGLSRMLRLASRDHYHLGDGPRALAVADEALAVLEGDELGPEAARAIAHLAQLRMTNGEWRASVELADRALALAEPLGDAWSIAQALITKGTSVAALGEPERALELLRGGRRVAVEHALHETAARSYNNELVVLYDVVAPAAEQLSLTREALAYVERHGVASAWVLHGKLGMFLVARGDYDAALDAVAAIPEFILWFGESLLVRGRVALAREGPRAALRQWERLEEIASRSRESQATVPNYANIAYGHALAGHRESAASWMARVDAGVRADDGMVRYLGWLGLGGFWVTTTAVLLGDLHWLDVLESGLAKYRSAPLVRAVCESARQIARADGGGEALARAHSLMLEAGYDNDAAEFVVASRIALGPVPPGAGWEEPLRHARAFATRVRATWFLEKL